MYIQSSYINYNVSTTNINEQRKKSPNKQRTPRRACVENTVHYTFEYNIKIHYSLITPAVMTIQIF